MYLEQIVLDVADLTLTLLIVFLVKGRDLLLILCLET